MLELRRLSVLREVARQGSFSAAAAQLNYSPSAISQQIAQLEREVGVTLVERKSNGVVLTRAGRVLLAHANAMLGRAADAEEELRQLAAGPWGRLRVAAFASAAAALLPPAIVAYREVQPRVAIELVEHDDSRESLDELRRGELDLAIIPRNGRETHEPDPEIDYTHLLDDYVDVLLPATHPLANATSLTFEALRDEAWADCSGDPVFKTMSALGIEPNIIFNGGHHHVTYSIVSTEIALAFCPRLTQPVLIPNVVSKPIGPEPMAREVVTATRASEHKSPALESLVDVLLAVAAARTEDNAAGLDLQLAQPLEQN